MHGTGRLAADLNVEEDLVGYFRIRLDGRDGDEHKGGNEERRARHFLSGSSGDGESVCGQRRWQHKLFYYMIVLKMRFCGAVGQQESL